MNSQSICISSIQFIVLKLVSTFGSSPTYFPSLAKIILAFD